MLLQRGAEIDVQDGKGYTALCAATTGHERVVELLLQHGADVNLQISDGAIALVVAAGVGNERVVELLLQHGADATVPRDTDVYTVVV